jgi:hypothetical protein
MVISSSVCAQLLSRLAHVAPRSSVAAFRLFISAVCVGLGETCRLNRNESKSGLSDSQAGPGVKNCFSLNFATDGRYLKIYRVGSCKFNRRIEKTELICNIFVNFSYERS